MRLVSQSCSSLCDPMDLAHQAPLSMRILQAGILWWVAVPSSGGIFPTQGSNSGLTHHRQILYCVSHSLPHLEQEGSLKMMLKLH